MIVFVVVVVAERIVVPVVHPAAEVTIWILTPSSDPMLRANGNLSLKSVFFHLPVCQPFLGSGPEGDDVL